MKMGRGAAPGLLMSLMAAAVPLVSEAQQFFDHAVWDGLLRRHVQAGLVDYAGVAKERETLDRYLASVAEVSPSQWPSKQAQLAFWINAYNACVFKGVLEHSPLKSVKDVKGFFDKIRYRVAGRDLVLNEIEAQGRALGDWRVHVGVVCASSSCPPIRAEAYVPDRLEAQLTEQVTQFFNDPQRGLRREANTLWLSKIFKWYAPDFVPGGKLMSESLLPVITPYVEAAVAQAIAQQKPTLKFLDYDWSLNGQVKR